MFYHWEANAPNAVFLRQPAHADWHEYTWRQFAQQVRNLASFIAEQDFPQGSRIGLLSANTVDWFVVDLGIMLAGHVSVPLYPTQDAASGRYILEHSEAQMIFLGPFNLESEVDAIIPPGVKRVAMRGCRARCDFRLTDIIASYPPYPESPLPARDDLLTLLYTAGTSGRPKAVMHTHSTVAAAMPLVMRAMKHPFNRGERGRLLSHLPLAHVSERILGEMLALYSNASVSFCEGPQVTAAELRGVKPTLFFSLPRLWVACKQAIDALFPPAVQATFGEEEKAFVRAHLGLDQARMILTGSGPTPKEAHQWFIDMGILLRDCYTMSESPAGASYADGVPEPGCAGTPSEGVAVKITERGEICFSSKSLMAGYYKNPAKSAEVLVDGWYHTGDSGRFDSDGKLWITGRMDEIFQTSGGQSVSPRELEGRFEGVSGIAEMVVCGHGRDQPVMLITLSESARAQKRATVFLELERALDEANAELPVHERIARLFVTRDAWSIDNGLLTPAMNLRRGAIEQRYKALIDAAVDAGRIVFE